MHLSNSKILRTNNTGELKSHQGGILVPKKNKEIFEFFPQLATLKKISESWNWGTKSNGNRWKMKYVYYDSKTLSPPSWGVRKMNTE